MKLSFLSCFGRFEQACNWNRKQMIIILWVDVCMDFWSNYFNAVIYTKSFLKKWTRLEWMPKSLKKCFIIFIRIPLNWRQFRGLVKKIWIIEHYSNIFQALEFKLEVPLPQNTRNKSSNEFNETHISFFEFEC